MRIGLITGEYHPMIGGVGAFTGRLASAIADLGHTVCILTDRRARPDDHRIPVAASIPEGHWNGRCYSVIAAWAREQQLEVINLQYQTSAYAMSPWIHFVPDRVSSWPIVTTFHDLRFPYLFPKAGLLRIWIVHHLARASAGVIATNHEDFVTLRAHQHAALIPIGSNIVAVRPSPADRLRWRSKTGAAPDDFLIAFFGFINASKGLDTLITALAQARAAGRSWRLVIIGDPTGSSDPTNARYAEMIYGQMRDQGLTDRIHITGFVDDDSVAAYLSTADAIALPYRDGVSLRRGTLMAALQSGTPIVTTEPRLPMPELDNALLTVAAGQPDALYQALLTLEQSPEMGQRLATRASEVSADFNWAAIAERTVAHFKQITADRSHPLKGRL